MTAVADRTVVSRFATLAAAACAGFFNPGRLALGSAAFRVATSESVTALECIVAWDGFGTSGRAVFRIRSFEDFAFVATTFRASAFRPGSFRASDLAAESFRTTDLGAEALTPEVAAAFPPEVAAAFPPEVAAPFPPEVPEAAFTPEVAEAARAPEVDEPDVDLAAFPAELSEVAEARPAEADEADETRAPTVEFFAFRAPANFLTSSDFFLTEAAGSPFAI